METLRSVFPAVPTKALVRVLEVCDQSVAVASTWLLENDWQELMEDEEDEEEGTNPEPNVADVNPDAGTGNLGLETARTSPSDSTAPSAGAQQATTMVLSTENIVVGNQEAHGTEYFARRSNISDHFQEEFDSEDEDEVAENEEEDEDEDEDDEDVYEDGFRVRGVPPLSNRVKITKSKEKAQTDDFWVSFDSQVVIKSMIELLNTTLSKVAHSSVVLLNQPAKDLDEITATLKLRSVLASEETIGDEVVDENLQSPRDASNRITLANLLNDSSPPAAKSIGKKYSSTTRDALVNLKRKRDEEVNTEDPPRQGFFAHFFPVRELDMIWRTVMHSHLFKGRFGETIEFHTASGGSCSERDFDELMHIQTSIGHSRARSLGFSPLSTLKCCLILPCPAKEDEIFRVGKNIHSMLKVQDSLYYHVVGSALGERSAMRPVQKTNSAVSPRVSLLGDEGSLTEEQFRKFAWYRVKEEEKEATKEEAKLTNVGKDPYMSYQQPRKILYCLQMLDTSKWTSCLTD